MGAGEPGSGDHLIHAHGGIGNGDIFAHRPIEKHVFLENDAHLPTQPGGSASARSVPSISTRPRSGTKRRWTSLMMVDLPEPEAPTIPTISPAAMSIETSERMAEASSR